ncbi:hypothetical protein [Caudoviricetes sp.]|nr:hypothetical protein [Caudoviricetes sp.]
MATQNLTRAYDRHKKRKIESFTTTLDFTVEVATSGDTYQLFKLPANSYVTKAEILVLTASDAGTSAVADVGFDGGDTLLDGVNLKSAANTLLSGGTNAVVPQLKATGGTVTFKPTYAGTASTVGKYLVRIDYIQIDKTSGEVTNFSTT